MMLRTTTLACLVACTGEIGQFPSDDLQGADDGHGNTIDPYSVLERIQREGPPRYTARVHSCPKIRYLTLGNVLASRGVDLTRTDDTSAAALYGSGAATLGAPNYTEHARESVDVGVATASRMFDIYVQAAPEIIANLGSRPECAGARLFDDAGRCVADGITCLIGVPATPQHLDLCNLTVARGGDVESGKQLAVAVLAAAAHTCE
jgi:hypothetical protein